MSVEIFRERPDFDVYDPREPRIERYDEITIDQLINMHCSVSYRQSVDLLVAFMKFQIALEPAKYVDFLKKLADEHDYKVEYTEDHAL